MLSRFFRSLFTSSKPKQSPIRRVRSRSLTLETLEQRLTPTTIAFQIPESVANLGVQVGIFNASQFLDPSTRQYTNVASGQTSVPLIPLTSPSITYSGSQWVSIPLPAGAFNSGEIIAFVGPVQVGVTISAGAITTPSVGSNPNDLFTQFEFSVGSAYDIDISFVDSVGVPLTATTPRTTTISAIDLNQVGIAVAQADVYSQFQAAFPVGNPFAQCFAESFGPLDAQGVPTGEIIAPKDLLQIGDAPPTLLNATQGNDGPATGNFLTAGQSYSYVITAASNNIIPNTTLLGQSLASAPISVVATGASPSIVLNWTAYTDPNTSGYNIYRSGAGSNSATYNLVGQVVGANVTAFEDKGFAPQAQTIVPATASNYGFNPLSTYFTPAIQSFFEYYKTHEFVFNSLADHTQYRGYTTQYTPPGSSEAYTVLELTSTYYTASIQGTSTNSNILTLNSVTGLSSGMYVTGPGIPASPPTQITVSNGAVTLSTAAGAGAGAGTFTFTYQNPNPGAKQLTLGDGQIVRIYQPFFSSNTIGVGSDLPPMPSWMQTGAFGGFMTPGEMVFGAEGAFNSGSFDPDALENFGPNGFNLSGPLSDIENAIDSAFNRGLAINFDVAPDNWTQFQGGVSWSNYPTVTTATSTSTLAVGSYQYKITSIDGHGETPASIPVNATITSANTQQVNLQWTQANPGFAVTGLSGLTTTTVAISVSSLPSFVVTGQPVTITGVVGAPVNGTYIVASTGTGTFSITMPSAPGGSYVSGGMVSAQPLYIAPAAISFNIYRLDPGETTYKLVGSQPNSAVQNNTFADSGANPPTTPLPEFFYPDPTSIAGTSTLGSATLTLTGGATTTGLFPGMAVTGTGIPAHTTIQAIIDSAHLTLSASASQTGAGSFTFVMPSNQYSKFIHDISINGMAYGFAYDDQGGYSSNNSLLADPGLATINLYPLTAGGASPTIHTTSLPGTSVLANFAQMGNFAQMVVATGGTGPLSYSINSSGTNVAWLAIDPFTGYLYNTDTPTAGPTSFTVTVTDSANNTTSQAYSFNVNANAIAIETSTLPNAIVGTNYNTFTPAPAIVMSPAVAPAGGTYSYSATGLPAWLTLNSSTGAFSGTPTAGDVGTVSIVVTVSDGAPGDTISQNYSFTVSAPTLALTSFLPFANEGSPYSETLVGTTTTGSTSVASVTGTGGATITSAANTSGSTVTITAANTYQVGQQVTISGVQTAGYNGVYTITSATSTNFTYTIASSGLATDTNGGFASVTGIAVGQQIAGPGIAPGTTIASFGATTLTLSQNATASGTAPFTATAVLASGGTGSYTYSITTGTLPPGLIFNTTTGVFSGSPTGAAVTYSGTGNSTKSITSITGPTGGTMAANGQVIAVSGVAATPVTTITSGAGTSSIDVSNDTGSGTLTLSTATNYTFTVQVTDSSGTSQSRQYTLTVLPLGVNAATLPNAFYQGSTYSLGVSGSFGIPPISATILSGPSWLTAAVAGTPTVTAAPISGSSTLGLFSYTLQVSDNATGTAPADISTLTYTGILYPALTVTTTLLNGTVGAPFNQSVTATGGTGSGYTYTGVGLPSWLTLNSSTGQLTGTPQTADAGNVVFSIVASDSAGGTIAQTYTFQVTGATNPIAIVTTTLAGTANGLDVGIPIAQSILTTGGTGTNSYQILAGGTNASWLSINPATGFLTGTPAAANVGAVSFTVQVTANSVSTQQAYSFTVYAALGLTPNQVGPYPLNPPATAGTAYTSTAIVPSGGNGPFTYSVNNLPTWLTLNTSTGVLSGTPGSGDVTASPGAEFNVVITDKTGASVSQLYTLMVNPGAGVFTNSSLGSADVNAPYYRTIQTSPTNVGSSFAATGLPTGLSLVPNLSGTAPYAIVGVPTTAGSNTVGLTATGVSNSPSYSLTVNPQLLLTTTTLAAATAGTAYSQTINTSGGGGTYTFVLSDGTALPSWLTLSSSGSTATLSGTPGSADAGTLNLVIRVTDSAGGSASYGYSLTVNPSSSYKYLNPNVVDRGTAFNGLNAQQHFVQATYLTELGRAGTVAELNTWVAILNSSPNGQAMVASGIASSVEACEYLVKGWYLAYLGRAAVNGEESGHVNLLRAGVSEESVLAGILGSVEFFNRAQTLSSVGGADERYVQTLYELVLGRTGVPEEVAGWLSQASVNRASVALQFLRSPEFRTNLVTSYYTVLLGRSATALEIIGWVNSSLDAKGIRLGFEGSPEFFING